MRALKWAVNWPFMPDSRGKDPGGYYVGENLNIYTVGRSVQKDAKFAIANALALIIYSPESASRRASGFFDTYRA